MYFIYSSLESAWSTSYSVKVGVFQRGQVTSCVIFRWKGTSPTDLFQYQNTRVIIVSCGIKISAVCSFDSSQSVRVTDRRTDNYDPQDRGSIAVTRAWQTRTLEVLVKCLFFQMLDSEAMIEDASPIHQYMSENEHCQGISEAVDVFDSVAVN